MNVATPLLLTALSLVGCTAANSEPAPANSTPDRQQAAVSGIPDNPVDNVPTTPVSPQFVLEHRSALNGRTVRIRGTVLRMVGPDSAASGGGVTPLPGGHPQPRLFLAAGPAAAGEPDHELLMLLREGDEGFPAGQVIEVDAVVQASRGTIIVTRVYSQT